MLRQNRHHLKSPTTCWLGLWVLVVASLCVPAWAEVSLSQLTSRLNQVRSAPGLENLVEGKGGFLSAQLSPFSGEFLHGRGEVQGLITFLKRFRRKAVELNLAGDTYQKALRHALELERILQSRARVFEKEDVGDERSAQREEEKAMLPSPSQFDQIRLEGSSMVTDAFHLRMPPHFFYQMLHTALSYDRDDLVEKILFNPKGQLRSEALYGKSSDPFLVDFLSYLENAIEAQEGSFKRGFDIDVVEDFVRKWGRRVKEAPSDLPFEKQLEAHQGAEKDLKVLINSVRSLQFGSMTNYGPHARDHLAEKKLDPTDAFLLEPPVRPTKKSLLKKLLHWCHRQTD